MRYGAIDQVGASRFSGPDHLPLRRIHHLRCIGGWAEQAARGVTEKLELYDQIDDYTGLFNARFFVQDTDLELSRSKRYQTIFSDLAGVLPRGPTPGPPPSPAPAIRKDLGRMLEEAVRTVDRAAHGFDGTNINSPACSPRRAGRRSDIHQRLAERVRAYLVRTNVQVPRASKSSHKWITFPDDGEEVVQELRQTVSPRSTATSTPKGPRPPPPSRRAKPA